jgi:hypothetical protein
VVGLVVLAWVSDGSSPSQGVADLPFLEVRLPFITSCPSSCYLLSIRRIVCLLFRMFVPRNWAASSPSVPVLTQISSRTLDFRESNSSFRGRTTLMEIDTYKQSLT